jgi:trans-2,3-dihydro-3-hydroxyanthranilate isomerase
MDLASKRDLGETVGLPRLRALRASSESLSQRGDQTAPGVRRSLAIAALFSIAHRAKGIARRHAIGLDEWRTRSLQRRQFCPRNYTLMKASFQTVDVFTDRQFGGNPVAVIPDARGLSDAQMQAIANEFNLAETTFVFPPADSANTARVRIFTPRAEMPFAGHPNVGTAFVLAHQERVCGAPFDRGNMTFEELAGLVRMTIDTVDGLVAGASLAAPQKFRIIRDIDVATIAQACSLEPSDIEVRRHPPCLVSCGAPFVIAEVRDRAALRRAQQRMDVFLSHLPRDEVTGIHLYVEEAEEGADFQSRMFAPLHGVFEDPATGSANVALIGLLAHLRPEPSLRLKAAIGQGVDLGRPSLLRAVAEKVDGAVTGTFIGGGCKPVMSGWIDLQ